MLLAALSALFHLTKGIDYEEASLSLVLIVLLWANRQHFRVRRAAAPNGVMDFLLVNLLSKSRDQGFERFSLGMAPMSGFREKEGASPEERAIHFFFRHLTFIFSFAGLRAYKAKFATDWEPRYVVYRHIPDLPRVALTLAKVSEIRSRF